MADLYIRVLRQKAIAQGRNIRSRDRVVDSLRLKRREFFKCGVALAALGLSGRAAAQAARVPVLGILAPYRPGSPLTGAFIARLAELGHVGGRTMRIEPRMIDGRAGAFIVPERGAWWI